MHTTVSSRVCSGAAQSDVQSPWNTAWGLLKKLKLELPYVPAMPPLGTDEKETKSLLQEVPVAMFTAALVTTGETQKQC